MPHTSAILAASLSWDDSSMFATRPSEERMPAQDEAMAWQNLSQLGGDAEQFAMPSLFARYHTRNGVRVEVPRQAAKLPPPNRLLEIHGLAGSIGEQFGLAWTAEQDVQRFRATSQDRDPVHQRLIQRALAELSGHFLLGSAHSLANLVLRLLLLNKPAGGVLLGKYPKAADFPPGTDDRSAWLTFNKPMIQALTQAAAQSGNPSMVKVVTVVEALRQDRSFAELDARRGLDYHRRRPQSVEHVSPRRDIVEHAPNQVTFTMPAPSLEPEADADAVHDVVVNAMESVRRALSETRQLIPDLIRAEGITYIFD